MDARLELTPEQKAHQEVMFKVCQSIQKDSPYILKGGTALIFAHNLPRHSTDLDFDSPKALNLEARVKAGFEAAGVELETIDILREGEKVKKLRASYINPAGRRDDSLLIETRIGHKPEMERAETINGIKTYAVDDLVQQKLAAFDDRTKARDLYDIAYLVQERGEQLSKDSIERAQSRFEDLDKVIACFDTSFKEHRILSGLDIDDLVLKMDDTLASLSEPVSDRLDDETIRASVLAPNQVQ